MSYNLDGLARLAQTKMDVHGMTAREACADVCGSFQIRGLEAEKVRTALERLLCPSALNEAEKKLLTLATKQIKEIGKARLPYPDD